MDIGPDVDTKSHLRRPSVFSSSPPTSATTTSTASSPQTSVFSYNLRSSRRSITSSSISSAGDLGQSEEDVAYYSDGESQEVLTSTGTPVSQSEHVEQRGGFPCPISHGDGYGEVITSPRTLLQAQNVAHWSRLSGANRPTSIKSPLPLSRRQNPRRTHRSSCTGSSNGTEQPTRPPPQLVRQCERKDSFVDSLVDTTTQTIETIWPLSMAQGRASADQNLIGLRTFVQEVLKRSKTSYSTLLVAIYYLVVVMSGLPKDDFTMEQKIDSDGFRAMQCGRRMFLAALILASKYLQDRNYSTRAWSKISGLKVTEINANERAFLGTVNWKLHMPEATFQRWERIVLKYSPSSNTPSVPRSSPAACQTWRSIVRQLNPDLDQFDNRGKLISDNDSGYYSENSAPSSRGSSPHAPRDSSATPSAGNSTTIPSTLPVLPPLTLEPTPQDSKSDHRMLPPLQPREGPLPTPQITPHIRSFCTPAVSASGLLPRRSSMSLAMNEHRRSWEESLLDCTNSWQSRTDSIPQRHFTHVPSSLSNYSSSPDSAADVSRFPSRSSSISSVASSNCALPEPCLAVGAMRRCADMKMSSLMDSCEESITGNASLPPLPVPPACRGSEFYFKERPKLSRSENGQANITNHATEKCTASCTNAWRSEPQRESHTECAVNAASSNQLTPCSTRISRASSNEDDEATPKPRSAVPANGSSLNSQTYQAAAALVDLTLHGKSDSRQLRNPNTADSRKRGRPLSMDFGLQSSVRDLIRPQSLDEVGSEDNDSAIVIPDDENVADSWLLKGGNGSSYSKNDELWATFDQQNESENRWNNRAVMSSRSVNTSSESLPRKKTCIPPTSNESKLQRKCAYPRSGCQSKTKIRGERKPAAEMNRMLRSAKAEHVEMHDPASRSGRLLYGEVRSW